MTETQVNTAIKLFCDEFITNPYIHRCEHSLHISLYNYLIKEDLQSISLCENFKTSFVHKEFPGRKTNEKSENKVDRTPIDIVVLSEHQKQVSINDFLEGNLIIDFAFEVSLEYGIEHLCWDIFKFIIGSNKSEGNKNFIIHLYNKYRTKSYCNINKINSNLMWNNNNTINENYLNKQIEWCYYLINLCIKYSNNHKDSDYKKIINIVLFFVNLKNKKYDKTYLLKENEIQEILQNMKFIYIDTNPAKFINCPIKLSNL